jgi:hypothetical protein
MLKVQLKKIKKLIKNGTSSYATSVTTRTVGANKSVFNWTWSEQANQLLSF